MLQYLRASIRSYSYRRAESGSGLAAWLVTFRIVSELPTIRQHTESSEVLSVIAIYQQLREQGEKKDADVVATRPSGFLGDPPATPLFQAEADSL